MATRSAISSQCAIIASWTALTSSADRLPLCSAAIRSATASIVTLSMASRPPKPVRSAELPTYAEAATFSGTAGGVCIATSPWRGTASWRPRVSSIVINCDCCRTTLTTFCGPRRVVTLSKVSTTSPPRLTRSLKTSSPPSVAPCTSTVRSPWLWSFAATVRAGLPSSPAAGSSATGAALPPATPRRQLGHRAGAVGFAGRSADPHDVGDAAAVEEVAVDGVREVVAVDEVTEGRLELGPVRDENGLVERTRLGEAHERGHRRADGLDRPGAGRDLLHVHTG